jgi:two-component system, NarL family, sensor kinase
MPRTLQQFGLTRAINDLCRHFILHTRIRVTLQCTQQLPALHTSLQVAIYRVMQELLNNVLKHSEASLVAIDISCTNGQLAIQFKDDGKGFNIHAAAGGMGLQNVQSRVASHNGKLRLESSRRSGTRYHIRFPILNPCT